MAWYGARLSAKRKTASVEAVYDFQHPVKVNLIIDPQGAPNQGFSKREPCPVDRPSHTETSFGAVSSAGVDLTGFEPAPATLTGCCASITPQAHGYDGNGESCELHVHPSHPGPRIPEIALASRSHRPRCHPERRALTRVVILRPAPFAGRRTQARRAMPRVVCEAINRASGALPNWSRNAGHCHVETAIRAFTIPAKYETDACARSGRQKNRAGPA
jgi:hypothetical protein